MMASVCSLGNIVNIKVYVNIMVLIAGCVRRRTDAFCENIKMV